MSKLLSSLAVILGILLLCGCGIFSYVSGGYNSLVKQEESVNTSWGQVETQYQRRFDLIPNLTNATQGFLNQEQKVFGDIAEARTRYAGAESGSNEKVEAQGQLDSALSRLLVIVENYPQLNSNETIRNLMDELAGTENRINIARQRYNEEVQAYNVKVRTFPMNLLATTLGFDKKELFASQAGAENAPTVNLNEDNQ